MGLFDKAKDLYTLQKQAKEVKKQLHNIHIEAEAGDVIVLCDGEQQFIEVKYSEALLATLDDTTKKLLEKLAKAHVEANNKAIKKSQMIGAEKMKSVMGRMGGLFGGEGK